MIECPHGYGHCPICDAPGRHVLDWGKRSDASWSPRDRHDAASAMAFRVAKLPPHHVVDAGETCKPHSDGGFQLRAWRVVERVAA